FLNGFNAAKPATDGSGKAATARFEAVIGRILQADLNVEAKLQILDMNALDLAGRSDNAFRQAEAQGEIFQVGWRCHHDCMGRATIGECNCGLLGQCARTFVNAITALGDARKRGEGRGHSVASLFARMQSIRAMPIRPVQHARYGGSALLARHIRAAIRSAHWTARPERLLPCIPGNWWPSPNI